VWYSWLCAVVCVFNCAPPKTTPAELCYNDLSKGTRARQMRLSSITTMSEPRLNLARLLSYTPALNARRFLLLKSLMYFPPHALSPLHVPFFSVRLIMIQNKILWIISSASEFKAQIINYTPLLSTRRECGKLFLGLQICSL
jgi:hypothetical protein